MVLEGGGGVQFSKSLEREGYSFIHNTWGGGVHFSPTCVFQEWNYRRFSFFLHLISRKSDIKCNVSSGSPVCCRQCFGGKLSHARNHVTRTYNQSNLVPSAIRASRPPTRRWHWERG